MEARSYLSCLLSIIHCQHLIPTLIEFHLSLSIRFKHDDGTCTSSLGLLSHNPSSGDGNGYMAVGAESGVVTLFKGDFRSRFHGVGISRYYTVLYSIGPLTIF